MSNMRESVQRQTDRRNEVNIAIIARNEHLCFEQILLTTVVSVFV
jgi:hypothetical protein